MGRSNGYRPKKAVREEVLFWREELAKCDSSEWLRANRIMQEITTLLGHAMGPGNGKIEPRACKWCGFYGHTRQWCPKFKAAEQASIDQLLKEDDAVHTLLAKPRYVQKYDPYNDCQAATFKRLGLKFRVDPDLGAVLA